MNENHCDDQTNKRAIISLTLATDIDPGLILAELPRMLGQDIARLIVGTSVHTYDMDEDSPEPSAHIVLSPTGVIWGSYLDADEADERASEVRGVLLEVPIVKDYRLPVADGA